MLMKSGDAFILKGNVWGSDQGTRSRIVRIVLTLEAQDRKQAKYPDAP